eukprot:740686-Amphidinium_carterae.1
MAKHGKTENGKRPLLKKKNPSGVFFPIFGVIFGVCGGRIQYGVRGFARFGDSGAVQLRGQSAERPSSADQISGLLAEAKLLNQMHRSCLRRARLTFFWALT